MDLCKKILNYAISSFLLFSLPKTDSNINTNLEEIANNKQSEVVPKNKILLFKTAASEPDTAILDHTADTFLEWDPYDWNRYPPSDEKGFRAWSAQASSPEKKTLLDLNIPPDTNSTLLTSKPYGLLVRYYLTAFHNKDESNYSNPSSALIFFGPGDPNLDKIVDVGDLAKVASHFGETKLSPSWDFILDLYQDGIIDIGDLVKVAINFGNSYLGSVGKLGSIGKTISEFSDLIYLNKNIANPAINDTLEIRIRVDDVRNLYAFQGDIRYNKYGLELTNIVEGDFLKNEGKTFCLKNMLDNPSIVITRLGGGGVNGSGELATLEFIVKNPSFIVDLDYKLVNTDMESMEWTTSTEQTDVEILKEDTTRDSLSQNYPNPFNSETTFKYSLAADSYVTLDVSNILGQRIRTLVGEQQSSDHYSVKWDGSDLNGNNVASGIYLFRLKVENKHGVYEKIKRLVKFE